MLEEKLEQIADLSILVLTELKTTLQLLNNNLEKMPSPEEMTASQRAEAEKAKE